MRIREAWTAAQTKPFNVWGNFLRVASANGLVSGSVDIKFWRGGQSLPVDLLAADPGDKVSVPGGFDYLEIASSVAQTIDVRIMRGDAGSDRITGEVSVIEGGKSRVLAGVAYQSYAYQGAVAAQFAHVQLWNPVGTGRRLIVSKVQVSPDTAMVLYLARYNVALATLGMSPEAKLLGGAVSVSVTTRRTTSGGYLGTFLQYVNCPANGYAIPMTEPIVIPEGQGLMVIATPANVGVGASFDHWEET